MELSCKGEIFDRAMLLALDLPLGGSSELMLYAAMHHTIVRAEGQAGPWRVSMASLGYEYVKRSGEPV